MNSLQKTLVEKFGFPNPLSNKGAWTDPKTSFLGRTLGNSMLVYHRGRVQAVVSGELDFELLCQHACGSAYSIPPPFLFFLSKDKTPSIAHRTDSQYRTSSDILSWDEVAARSGGQLSPKQADLIIQHVASGAKKWLEDPRSQHMLGILPRIFTGEVAVVYELVQNAADAGASKVAFRFHEGALVCEHNGYPFSEIDVQAISEVNFSTKSPDKIGFMGVGFKSVFEVSKTPEVFSAPYSFFFDGTESYGRIIPLPIVNKGISAGFTTQFRLPLNEGKEKFLLDELEQFDGKLLLYLKGSLKEIQTHQVTFRLPPSTEGSQLVIEEIGPDGIPRRKQRFFVKKRSFEASGVALAEFAGSRQQKVEDIRASEQQVSLAIPLADDGGPLTDYKGKLQVYLPTSVHLPFAFDLQGNFLIDASRQQLSYPKGNWNREYFFNAGVLIGEVFSEVAKRVADGESFCWERFYDLFPDWVHISPAQFPYLAPPSAQDKEACAKLGFDSVADELLIAPTEQSNGELGFVKFGSALVIDERTSDLFSAKEFKSLTGFTPVWQKLSQFALSKVSVYCGKFTPDGLLEVVARDGWSQYVDVLEHDVESKQSRRWLERVYQILFAHRQQQGWYVDESKYKKAKIFLTKEKTLAMAEGNQDGKPLRVMPLEGTSFDTVELEKKYSLLHATLTRELKKRDDVTSESEKETLAQANMFVDKYLITLSPETIVKEVIEPAFDAENWKRLPDEILFRYSKFVLEAIGKLPETPSIKLKTKSRARLYKNPGELYLGKEYGAESFETFIGEVGLPWIVSSDYAALQSQPEDSGKWARLFVKLGAAQLPRVSIVSKDFYKNRRLELQEILGGEKIPDHRLRGTWYEGIPANSYVLLDYFLDKLVVATLDNLVEKRGIHWRFRLQAFAKMIDRNWKGGYDKYLHKQYKYVLRGQQDITVERSASLSELARSLKEKKWLPVYEHEFCETPAKLTRLSEESITMSRTDCLFADLDFESESFVAFLGVNALPPGTTAISKVEVLVRDGVKDVTKYRDAYLEILEEIQSGSITKEQVQKSFKEEALIFAPTLDDRFIKADRALFECLKGIKSYFASIKDIYPDLEEFFCVVIGIPKMDSIEHVLRFLMEHVWVRKPPITDEFRSDLVSCYNQVVNHFLSEDGLQRLSGEFLWTEFKSKLTLFCRNKDWVSKSSGVKFIYPDSSRLAAFLEDAQDIGIESHFQRTKKTVAALKPLLDELGISVASDVVDESVSTEGKDVHPLNEDYRRDLYLLIVAVVSYVQAELDEAEGNARRQLDAFMQQFLPMQNSWQHVRFYHAHTIKATISRKDNGTVLDVQDRDSSIVVDDARIECIMTSDEIIDVYGTVAEQLVQRLGIEQLPESARNIATQTISSNAGKLGRPNFRDSLAKSLREKSIDWHFVELTDQISKDIVDDLRKSIEQDVNANLENKQSGTENPSRGGTSQSPQPPTDPTIDEPDVSEVIASWPALSIQDVDYDHVDQNNWEAVQPPARKPDHPGGGGGRKRDPKRDNILNEAYGKRGEDWVKDNEVRKLKLLGQDYLADKVKHISVDNPTNLWDIESFEKTPPFKPVRIEVKSTPDPDNFTFPISSGQLMEGAKSDDFFIYRVVDVTSSNPRIYVYQLQQVLKANQYQVQHKDVFLTLPRKKPE